MSFISVLTYFLVLIPCIKFWECACNFYTFFFPIGFFCIMYFFSINPAVLNLDAVLFCCGIILRARSK